MGRKPELTFAKFYRMLGRSAEHPLVQEVLKQYFPYEIFTNEVRMNRADYERRSFLIIFCYRLQREVI